MVRRMAVAGHFYPGEPRELERELHAMVPAGQPARRVKGLMAPHAGYVYSGRCAGAAYARVQVPARVVVLGVNHRGYGHPLAVDDNDEWDTPLGTVAVDDELRERLLEKTSVFGRDARAGAAEHSLEVQVPFLRFRNPAVRILPVTVGVHDPDVLLTAGQELGALFGHDPDLLVVASTDMSHYISAAHAAELDHLALERVLALDPYGLFEVVAGKRISM